MDQEPPIPTLFPRSLLQKRLLRSTDNLVTVFLTLNQWTFPIFGSQCSLTNVRCSLLKGTVNQSHTFSIVYRPTLEYDKKHNFQ